MGVVVRRYIDILTIILLIFPTPLVLALFLAAYNLYIYTGEMRQPSRAGSLRSQLNVML